jgi:competence ComEA-like helix-hairpin-helix protein
MRGWREGWWSARERGVVAGALVVMLGVLGYRYATRPAYVAEPLPGEGARAGEVVSRIDPNVATWEELGLLPGIGEKRARAIVAYREQYVREHAGEAAFKSVEDLMNISGVGEATVENLAPYLAVGGGRELEGR